MSSSLTSKIVIVPGLAMVMTAFCTTHSMFLMGKAGLARVWLALDRMTCEKLITHIEQPNSSRNAHLKPLLRAHFLREQDGGDAEHGSLPVDETPAQSNVPPDGLHHAQAEGVEGVPNSHGRELVLH